MKKIVLSLFLIFSIALISVAQADRSKKPLPGPAPKISIAKFDTFRLENGLKVFVIENHKVPMVSYSLIIDNDPILEKENAGYVELAGSLLRTGTKNLSKDQLDEAVDFIGGNISTNSSGIFANAIKKHNERLLELMSDILLNPNFTQEELDKLKKQKISELASQKDDPAAIASRVNNVLLYGKEHPYGENASEETVGNVTLNMCKNFYNTYYKPNIAYLAIVGDINVVEAKPLIEKYFGKWKKGIVTAHKYRTPLPPLSNTIAIVDRPNSVQSNIIVSYPVDMKPGTEDVIKSRVMNNILGGGTSRLFDNLREKHAYTYGAYSQLSPDKLIGHFMATAEVRNAVTDSSVYQIFYEINRIRDEKVPQEELDLYKNYLNGIFSLSLESPQTVASFAINIERNKMSSDYYTNYLKNLAAVSAEDVQSAAKKYLRPENAYILVVGKADEIVPKLTKVLKTSNVEYYDSKGNYINISEKTKAIPGDITAEKVIKKYISAIGGEEKVLKVNTLVKKIKANAQGMVLEIETSQKSPDKLLIDVSANGNHFQKQVLKGDTAKTFSPMGNMDVKGTELADIKFQANIFPELKYSVLGVNVKLSDIEEVNGKDAYKVVLTLPSGSSMTDYYDIESGLKVKTVEKQATTLYSEYKELAGSGIKFPYKIKIEGGGQSVDFEVSSYEVNKDLNDNIFEIKQ
ncbi:MAG: pitrilysin family protein [Bacteroidota bacterium]|nr:pitrilysin family protein [Bacteroidota bacterium]